MVKGVDVAVFDAIKRVKDHTFKGGIYTFGLAENGVGYVYDENNQRADSRLACARGSSSSRRTSSPARSSCRAPDEHDGIDAGRRSPHRHRQIVRSRARQPRRVARGRARRDSRARRRERRRQVDADARAERHVRAGRRPHGSERPRRHRLVDRRRDRRRRRHGAPALHARAHAHRRRERGARPRAHEGRAARSRARRARSGGAESHDRACACTPIASRRPLRRRSAARRDSQDALSRREDPHPRRADRGALAARGRRAVGGAAADARRAARRSSSSRTSSTR